MALNDEVKKLKEAAISSLDESHDYFTNTKRVWRAVQLQIAQGREYEFQNPVTGNTVTEKEMTRLAQKYVTEYLASATFQHFVSLLENFVIDLIRLWLTEYPKNLSSQGLEFQTVLDSADKSEIISACR